MKSIFTCSKNNTIVRILYMHINTFSSACLFYFLGQGMKPSAQGQSELKSNSGRTATSRDPLKPSSNTDMKTTIWSSKFQTSVWMFANSLLLCAMNKTSQVQMPQVCFSWLLMTIVMFELCNYCSLCTVMIVHNSPTIVAL